MEEFEKIVVNILSNEQSAREYGEKTIESLLKHSPDQLSYELIKGMENPSIEISSLCAVLYRRLFIEDESNLAKFSNSNTKTSLLNLITPSKPLVLLKKIGDILIQLASKLNFSNEILSKMTE